MLSAPSVTDARAAAGARCHYTHSAGPPGGRHTGSCGGPGCRHVLRRLQTPTWGRCTERTVAGVGLAEGRGAARGAGSNEPSGLHAHTATGAQLARPASHGGGTSGRGPGWRPVLAGLRRLGPAAHADPGLWQEPRRRKGLPGLVSITVNASGVKTSGGIGRGLRPLDWVLVSSVGGLLGHLHGRSRCMAHTGGPCFSSRFLTVSVLLSLSSLSEAGPPCSALNGWASWWLAPLSLSRSRGTLSRRGVPSWL